MKVTFFFVALANQLFGLLAASPSRRADCKCTVVNVGQHPPLPLVKGQGGRNTTALHNSLLLAAAGTTRTSLMKVSFGNLDLR